MPALRNVVTGVAVSCDDDIAARLGVEWEPVEDEPVNQEPIEDEPAPTKRAARRR